MDDIFFSHTRSGFPLFYPCDKILSHSPHAGHTSIRDVIVMLKSIYSGEQEKSLPRDHRLSSLGKPRDFFGVKDC